MGMVTSVTSLGKNGLYDFIIQRGSAVVLGLYFVCLTSFLLFNGDMTYETWRAYMSSGYMKVFTFLALISLAAHAWIGMWAVATDYLTTRQLGKPATTIRVLFLSGVFVVTVAYLVIGVQILWGA